MLKKVSGKNNEEGHNINSGKKKEGDRGRCRKWGEQGGQREENRGNKQYR